MEKRNTIEVYLNNAQSNCAKINVIINGKIRHTEWLDGWCISYPKKDGILLLEDRLVYE